MDLQVSTVNKMAEEAENQEEETAAVDNTVELEADAEAAEVEETEASENITTLPQSGAQHARMLEAMLFASARPLTEKELAERMPKGVDIGELLTDLAAKYEKAGVHLQKVADKWAFQTAADLNYLFQKEAIEPKRLSKAAIETLAIIAYHQPVTRAEIEEIRGVTVSRGTLDLLLDVGWIRLRGRRRTPGRPITFGTTDNFLEHFGLENVGDLPGLDDLKSAGLLDANLPPNFSVPGPNDELAEDEDPYDENDPHGEMLEPLEDTDPSEQMAEEPEAEADTGVETAADGEGEEITAEKAGDDETSEAAEDDADRQG